VLFKLKAISTRNQAILFQKFITRLVSFMCTCVGRCQAALQHCVSLAASVILSRRPSSSRLSLLWCSVDSIMVMAHWSASRPTLSADSSRFRTQRHDWYSVSVDPIISRMHSSASIGCECPKGLFSRSPCSHIELSYGSSHRSPTSHLLQLHGVLVATVS